MSRLTIYNVAAQHPRPCDVTTGLTAPAPRSAPTSVARGCDFQARLSAVASQTRTRASIATEHRRAPTLSPQLYQENWRLGSTSRALPRVAVGAHTPDALGPAVPEPRSDLRSVGPCQEGACPRGELSPGQAGLGAYTPRLAASSATTQTVQPGNGAQGARVPEETAFGETPMGAVLLPLSVATCAGLSEHTGSPQ